MSPLQQKRLAVESKSNVVQVYTLKVGSWAWREHTADVTGEAPPARSGHTAAALPDGRSLLVFGGGNADSDVFFSSVALLDTLTWAWSTPRLQARPAAPAGFKLGYRGPRAGDGARSRDSKNATAPAKTKGSSSRELARKHACEWRCNEAKNLVVVRAGQQIEHV